MMQIANAPCSWGILEFESDAEPAGFEQVLDEMQQTGYAGAELGDWGFMPTDPARLSQELQKRGLTMLGAFVPVALADEAAHDDGERRALRTANLLAAVEPDTPVIVLADDNGSDRERTRYAGRTGPQHMLDDARWQTFARGAERIARAVRRETGLRTVFHHHGAGYVETAQELERLMSLTDPDVLGLCLDTGHLRFGGGDPLAAIEQYAPRIWHVHFKDFDPQVAERARRDEWDYFEQVRHGVFCELGQGDVDFPAVVDALKRVGYEGWIVVEQDVLPGLGTPKESAARNRAYLHQLGL
ncbi:MAG: TIM barrel protein [Chloroflexota bacterium]